MNSSPPSRPEAPSGRDHRDSPSGDKIDLFESEARRKLTSAFTASTFTASGAFAGELSTSALSTATACSALSLFLRHGGQHSEHSPEEIEGALASGVRWLIEHQNSDGGFGDTVDSPSNISTTLLGWVALGLRRGSTLPEDAVTAEARVEQWITRKIGGVTPPQITSALNERYGRDRTFSVPILSTCALGGRFGNGRPAWQTIPHLPFELAACPQSWFRRLGLPMVSYALPALIALGQAHHHHSPSRNPITRSARALTRKPTLRTLQAIQPSTGGYLEATPLTSFVLMSLASMEHTEHPVAQKGIGFLLRSMRESGGWPIDTNLDTWTTTLSINALGHSRTEDSYGADERKSSARWLLNQQYSDVHLYTGAPPGAWAWTDLSGGVPDADDTAGTLLALHHLAKERGGPTPQEFRAAIAGIGWLLDLQNRDGGIPTFCRGWGKLPFDRSSPDLTAHALRAWKAWEEVVPEDLAQRIASASARCLAFLHAEQQRDGSWIPLWFGSQKTDDEENPLIGTTRVLRAFEVLAPLDSEATTAAERGLRWILENQDSTGGFGARRGIEPSIEETALAIDALAGWTESDPRMAAAITRATDWLEVATEGGTHFPAAPLGLYFAKLWYSEALYPLIFTVGALERTRHLR